MEQNGTIKQKRKGKQIYNIGVTWNYTKVKRVFQNSTKRTNREL